MMRLLRRVRLAFVVMLLALAGAAPISGCASSGGCCRVCRQGKACGDTCIAQNEQCTTGAGCACDG